MHKIMSHKLTKSELGVAVVVLPAVWNTVYNGVEG